jgi:hypothetical protein
VKSAGVTQIKAIDPTSQAPSRTIAVTPHAVQALAVAGSDELAVQVDKDIFRIPASPEAALDLKGVKGVASGDLVAWTEEGGLLTLANVKALANARDEDDGFAVSPDGSRLVFSSPRGGGSNLYITNANGGGTKPLTLECEDCGSPAWSGDGWVYFDAYGTLHRLKP